MECNYTIDHRLNDNGNWESLFVSETETGEKIEEWVGCTVNEVPIQTLFNTIDMLLAELFNKEARYNGLKEKYDNNEFEIVYVADIDYKALYGSTAEKVRKQHAKMILKDSNKEIQDLELSIDYLKKEISFLKLVVRAKIATMELHIDN